MPATQEALSSSDKLYNELVVATDASIGIIVIRCAETEVYRVVDDLYTLAMSVDMEFQCHTMITGWAEYARISPEDTTAMPFDPVQPLNTNAMTADVGKAFEALDKTLPQEGFYAMLDLYFTFAEPRTQAAIRRQAHRSLSCGQRLFLVVPTHAELPAAIAPLSHVIDFGYPDADELKVALYDLIQELDPKDRPDLDDDEVAAILANGQGMTKTAFDTAVALAITDYSNTNDGADGIGASDFLSQLREYKTQLLLKTNVLELQKPVPVENIGGLDLFIEWMEQRAVTFTDEAAEQNITPSKGALVIGPPGCKAEGTVVHYRRGKRNSSRSMPIEDFVRKFNGEPVPRRKGWDLSIPTYVQSWDSETGQLFYNRVIGAYATGSKPVVVIRTPEDEVRITRDDSVLMVDGTFKRAKGVKIGDVLLVRGSMKPLSQGGRNKNRPRRVVEGLKYYDSGTRHAVITPEGDFHYKRQAKARLVIEARMNDLTYNEYVRQLKECPNHPYRSVLSSAFEVHHMDEDPMNDAIGNLEVLTKSEHLERHRNQSITNLNVEHTREAVVTSVVTTLRSVPTYDLQLEAPACNYWCNNGIITHNTGKSLLAAASGSILNLPVIRFDVGRVFGSYVGQSEQSMRGVLTLLDAMAPCVLMLDEIDKGFAGMSGGSGGDSGTTMRVFGTFLTWMQERNQKDRPIFLIMTANRVGGLPPELLRKGRIDEIWSVNVPNREERATILEIHARIRGRKINAKDIPSSVRITERLVGAEIEALVEDALVISLANGKAEVTAETLEEARRHLKPMSDTRKDEFKAMEDWAKINARPASSEDTPTATPRPNVIQRGTKKRRPRVKPKISRNDNE